MWTLNSTPEWIIGLMTIALTLTAASLAFQVFYHVIEGDLSFSKGRLAQVLTVGALFTVPSLAWALTL